MQGRRTQYNPCLLYTSRLAVRHAVVINGAAGNGAVGIQQAHEALGKNALAGAALAYDGKHLCLLYTSICTPTVMKGYYNKPEETDMILRRHADGQILSLIHI